MTAFGAFGDKARRRLDNAASEPFRKASVLLGKQPSFVAGIAGECFVAAIPDQGDGDMFPRLARQVMNQQRRRVAERLAEAGDAITQQIHQPGACRKLGVTASYMRGNTARR